jgi:tetratricopeptide (TPR) repeat protein
MSDLLAALRFLAREEYVEGRDALLALVAARPDDATAWAYLSGAHLALAQADAAQVASARALELDPGGFAPLLKAGELSLRLGDLHAAEARFVAALRSVEPASSEAAAARRALVVVRTRLRGSVAHRASFPALRTLAGRVRRPSPQVSR